MLKVCGSVGGGQRWRPARTRSAAGGYYYGYRNYYNRYYYGYGYYQRSSYAYYGPHYYNYQYGGYRYNCWSCSRHTADSVSHANTMSVNVAEFKLKVAMNFNYTDKFDFYQKLAPSVYTSLGPSLPPPIPVPPCLLERPRVC